MGALKDLFRNLLAATDSALGATAHSTIPVVATTGAAALDLVERSAHGQRQPQRETLRRCVAVLATKSPMLSLWAGAVEDLLNVLPAICHGHCAGHHRLQHGTCGCHKWGGGPGTLERPALGW